MSFDLLVNPDLNKLLLPGNTHVYDKPYGRPIGSDHFRVTMTIVVDPDPCAERDYLERCLLPEHRRPGRSYGLVYLESQIMSAMMVTGDEEILRWRAGRAALPTDQPVYADWLDGESWEDRVPQTSWYPGGTGVLVSYDNVAGGTVTVYEYRTDKAQMFDADREPSGETVNMVTFHCDRCHTPDEVDRGERFENRGPHDRAWAAKKARAHARGDLVCEVPDGQMERVVAAVASEHQGRTVPVTTRAARCATQLAGCGGVREATAVTARLLAEVAR